MDEFIESLKKNVLVLDLNKFIETYGLFPAIASQDYMTNEIARAQKILPVHPKSSLASFFEGQIPKVDDIVPQEISGVEFEYSNASGLYLPKGISFPGGDFPEGEEEEEEEDSFVPMMNNSVEESLIVSPRNVKNNVYRLEDKLAERRAQISYGAPRYNVPRTSGLYQFISKTQDNYLTGRTFERRACEDKYYRLRRVNG